MDVVFVCMCPCTCKYLIPLSQRVDGGRYYLGLSEWVKQRFFYFKKEHFIALNAMCARERKTYCLYAVDNMANQMQ